MGVTEIESRLPGVPSGKQELLLRQIITAGFVDRVAELYEDENDGDEATRTRRVKHQYRVCVSNKRAFIHPESVLFPSFKPKWDYIVYKDLTMSAQSEKVYMRGVTGIQCAWLSMTGTPLCRIDDVCDKPPVRYDTKKDVMYCHVSPRYGPNSWSLPIHEILWDLGNSSKKMKLLKYKYFAKLLLEGQVFEELQKIRPILVGWPEALVKDVVVQHRVIVLLRAAVTRKIDSRKALVEIWKKEPNYLKPEIALWIPREHHAVFENTWRTIQAKYVS
eukprot:TRINITY_DN3891_c0_g2_i1.p1 TRINITY_DN3891_c0_g2~~TRINITY_DN3891_c0_g2_i1.p1  ORF type:complete len:315 (-),score=25.39 TRINITY_DN3891_c0_g2_i1:199-1023(-)